MTALFFVQDISVLALGGGALPVSGAAVSETAPSAQQDRTQSGPSEPGAGAADSAAATPDDAAASGEAPSAPTTESAPDSAPESASIPASASDSASAPTAGDAAASESAPAAGSASTLPDGDTPPEQTPPEQTPPEQTPPEQTPPEQTPEPEPEPEPEPQPAPGYRQWNRLATATTPKGLQGGLPGQYDIQHSLMNFWVDSYIDDEDPGTFGYCWPYEYEGSTFYFDLSNMEMMMERIHALNEANISVTAVFLVKYTEGREFLIDEASRVPGYKYYAPATTGEGGKAMRAFFEFFMWRCAEWGVSVDNFVLGNEINNPYSWHYSGTMNAGTVAAKYAAAFCDMYNIVRKYTYVSRCSIPLDHNWTHNDQGRQIPGRTMLNAFAAAVDAIQPDVNWGVAYHLYPAIMYNTAIWRGSGYNIRSPHTMFIDGMNLDVLTDYIRDNFGEEHRITLTEQGFCLYNGNELYQAASLIITYYAAKYNPMVDNFILNTDSSWDARLNFTIEGHLAESVYQRLDNGNPADQLEMEQIVLQASGRTLAELVPGYVPVVVEEPVAEEPVVSE